VKNALAVLLLGLVMGGCANGAPTTQNKAPSGSSAPATTRAPDEAAALDALRKINEAQSIYFKLHRRYALGYDELVEARLLKTEPSSTGTGYDFKLRPAADAQTYKLYVAPTDTTERTARHFFSDQSGALRAEIGKDATAESSPSQ
jgi:hypothetical protein